jgi:hypothetical protein
VAAGGGSGVDGVGAREAASVFGRERERETREREK